jgi:hypothetical protein
LIRDLALEYGIGKSVTRFNIREFPVGERISHASPYTSRGKAYSQPVDAEGAFVHFLLRLVKGGSPIWTGSGTAFASDAFFLVDEYSAELLLFRDCPDRAGLEARGLFTVIASGGNIPYFHIGVFSFLLDDDPSPLYAQRNIEFLLAASFA